MQKKIKFALFGNVYQERKCAEVEKFIQLCDKYEAGLAVSDTFYTFLSEVKKIDMPQCELIRDNRFTADYVVCMGGDGTFLDAATRVGDKEIPIIGINTGRLGFLASFLPDQIEQTFEDLYNDNFNVESRSVLQITCDEMELQDQPYALNEIALLKHDIASMISIRAEIDGEYLTTYQADGLIVSTPTGSTAYSLSVGGPIIAPQLDTVCLTPVAPHTLNMRPVVICDDSEISLTVKSRSHSFLVSVDGRSHSYPENIHLHIRRAPYCVKVVTRKGESFFSTLRRKMMWGQFSIN